MGGDEEPRRIAPENELGHDNPAAEEQPGHEEDEAGLDVAPRERSHDLGVGLGAGSKRMLITPLSKRRSRTWVERARRSSMRAFSAST